MNNREKIIKFIEAWKSNTIDELEIMEGTNIDIGEIGAVMDDLEKVGLVKRR